jgi:hypothetical protein
MQAKRKAIAIMRRSCSDSLLTASQGDRVFGSDRLVLDRLRAFFSSRIDVGDAIAPLDFDARELDAALRNALKLSERWLAAPPVEIKSLVRDIVEQITVAADRIEIWLSQATIAAVLESGGRSERTDLDPIVLLIEARTVGEAGINRLSPSDRALLQDRKPAEPGPSERAPYGWGECS